MNIGQNMEGPKTSAGPTHEQMAALLVGGAVALIAVGFGLGWLAFGQN